MKIYFFCSEEYYQKAKSLYPKIHKILAELDFVMISNLDNHGEYRFSPEEVEKTFRSGRGTLAQMDGLLLEITKFNPQIIYLLNQAIIQKKQTLCLYHKNYPPRNILAILKKKKIPKFIIINSYAEKILERRIVNFLRLVKVNSKVKVP